MCDNYQNQVDVKKDLKEKLGSCNFCDRQNYRKVIEMKGRQCSARICQKCLNKAYKESKSS